MTCDEVQNALGAHSKAIKVVRQIGSGGFGSVWLAHDLTLGNRPVAIKVLERMHDYDGVRNYSGGVRQHPNLLQIFFCDQCDGRLFYAMELADDASGDGEYRADTLAGRLAGHVANGTHPSPESVRRLVLGLLDGLDTMHAAGFCHRDVKPENVIFVSGTPKLSDVGSVRRLTDADTSGVTPAYLPPEMREGAYDPVAHDLYALGMIVYCCLALRSGESYPLIDDLTLLQDPIWRRLNAFVTERACSEDPSRRCRSADEFRDGFLRCFRRFPLRQAVAHTIGVSALLAALTPWIVPLVTSAIAAHTPGPVIDGLKRAVCLNAAATQSGTQGRIALYDRGVRAACVWLSDEIGESDLPLSFELSDLPPGASLRLALADGAEIPDRVRSLYENWSDWRVFPSCEVVFLRGRGVVTLVRSSVVRRSSTAFGEVLSDSSRTAMVRLQPSEGGYVDVLVNGKRLVPRLIRLDGPIRLLVAVSSPVEGNVGFCETRSH